jgi:hypothetical protein
VTMARRGVACARRNAEKTASDEPSTSSAPACSATWRVRVALSAGMLAPKNTCPLEAPSLHPVSTQREVARGPVLGVTLQRPVDQGESPVRCGLEKGLGSWETDIVDGHIGTGHSATAFTRVREGASHHVRHHHPRATVFARRHGERGARRELHVAVGALPP